jgi:choline dehydrogenase-like flavoprotein
MHNLSEITKQHWDAIIVGPGMGGATLGYALARAGWRVLFCEKGKSHLDDTQSLRGDYAEKFFSSPSHMPNWSHIMRLQRNCTAFGAHTTHCEEIIPAITSFRPHR